MREDLFEGVIVNQKGFSLSTQEIEYSASCVEETPSIIYSKAFQGYPIYLTLHKILDGTSYFSVYDKLNQFRNYHRCNYFFVSSPFSVICTRTLHHVSWI